ncbi:ABC transporter substrate-binding protein [Roseomonas sp. GC11]|uniref:ABC transporter substrate-binding protein n=1 Tax=Roseomonas sp. GC11 TaxID=2950546 RepID=UPI00210AD52E|nr:ABC transporter substrate-binding protein [Roseomonas sp. GC11]MCQ4162784.1 ABC transporter substrate-binding protein [Roseomonas sp. GC11]
MKRRHFLLTAGAGLAAPALALAQNSRVLRFIPDTDLAVIDPLQSTTFSTRNHAYMVYDTLYGMNAGFRAEPQMLEGHRVEDDGRRWILTLREGLLFHDGSRVLARDCVASIRRWAAREGFGATLLALTDELSALDDRRLQFRLRRPFPMLPEVLAKTGGPACVMMPERLALTDPMKPVPEIIGSGPFRFLAGERLAGVRNAYARFEGYQPREDGSAEWTAGPKIVRFDRVEWTTLPDPATAAAALATGEQDWMAVAPPDLIPMMRRNARLRVSVQDQTGLMGIMRPNHLHPPFNNPAIRRALLKALDQVDFMQATVGTEPSMYRTGIGYFCPQGPMATAAGMEVLTAPRDLEGAKRDIIAAGYKGEKVVVMTPSDLPSLNALNLVAADLLQRLGFNVELVATDWATMAQRRNNKNPPDKGGWSLFCSSTSGTDLLTPATIAYMRGNGEDGLFGWPTSPRIEALRTAWMEAPDLARQQALCAELQQQCLIDLPYYPLGQSMGATACRADLSGMVAGFPIFWGLRRA